MKPDKSCILIEQLTRLVSNFNCRWHIYVYHSGKRTPGYRHHINSTTVDRVQLASKRYCIKAIGTSQSHFVDFTNDNSDFTEYELW